MTPHVRHVYTDATRERAIELYREHGPTRAARQLSAEIGFTVHRQTLLRWAQKAGVTSNAVDTMAAAHAAEEARREAQRDRIKSKLLQTIEDLLDRIPLPHIEFKGNNAHQVQYPVAPSSACASYAVAIGTLIDKYRLENGESTSRGEVTGKDGGPIEHRHDYSDLSDAELEAEYARTVAEAESITRGAASEGGEA
jgi:hypothetical protein